MKDEGMKMRRNDVEMVGLYVLMSLKEKGVGYEVGEVLFMSELKKLVKEGGYKEFIDEIYNEWRDGNNFRKCWDLWDFERFEKVMKSCKYFEIIKCNNGKNVVSFRKGSLDWEDRNYVNLIVDMMKNK